MMRLFVAVNLDAAVRDAVERAVRSFALDPPPWRWTLPETWHLTLKFIGELDERQLPTLEEAVAAASARHAGFDLAFGAFGAFPNLRRPRVLFYRVRTGARPLSAMSADVDQAVHRAIGLARESRPFRAHLTLARVRSPLAPSALAALSGVGALRGAAQRVNRITLMQSELHREGARYRVVKEFALPPGT